MDRLGNYIENYFVYQNALIPNISIYKDLCDFTTRTHKFKSLIFVFRDFWYAMHTYKKTHIFVWYLNYYILKIKIFPKTTWIHLTISQSNIYFVYELYQTFWQKALPLTIRNLVWFFLTIYVMFFLPESMRRLSTAAPSSISILKS